MWEVKIKNDIYQKIFFFGGGGFETRPANTQQLIDPVRA